MDFWTAQLAAARRDLLDLGGDVFEVEGATSDEKRAHVKRDHRSDDGSSKTRTPEKSRNTKAVDFGEALQSTPIPRDIRTVLDAAAAPEIGTRYQSRKNDANEEKPPSVVSSSDNMSDEPLRADDLGFVGSTKNATTRPFGKRSRRPDASIRLSSTNETGIFQTSSKIEKNIVRRDPINKIPYYRPPVLLGEAKRQWREGLRSSSGKYPAAKDGATKKCKSTRRLNKTPPYVASMKDLKFRRGNRTADFVSWEAHYHRRYAAPSASYGVQELLPQHVAAPTGNRRRPAPNLKYTQTRDKSTDTRDMPEIVSSDATKLDGGLEATDVASDDTSSRPPGLDFVRAVPHQSDKQENDEVSAIDNGRLKPMEPSWSMPPGRKSPRRASIGRDSFKSSVVAPQIVSERPQREVEVRPSTFSKADKDSPEGDKLHRLKPSPSSQRRRSVASAQRVRQRRASVVADEPERARVVRGAAAHDVSAYRPSKPILERPTRGEPLEPAWPAKQITPTRPTIRSSRDANNSKSSDLRSKVEDAAIPTPKRAIDMTRAARRLERETERLQRAAKRELRGKQVKMAMERDQNASTAIDDDIVRSSEKRNVSLLGPLPSELRTRRRADHKNWRKKPSRRRGTFFGTYPQARVKLSEHERELWRRNVIRSIRRAIASRRSLFGHRLQPAHVEDVFATMDSSKDGLIDRSELREALRRLDIALSDTQLRQLFEHMDKNHDGQLQLSEFRDLLRSAVSSTRAWVGEAKCRNRLAEPKSSNIAPTTTKRGASRSRSRKGTTSRASGRRGGGPLKQRVKRDNLDNLSKNRDLRIVSRKGRTPRASNRHIRTKIIRMAAQQWRAWRLRQGIARMRDRTFDRSRCEVRENSTLRRRATMMTADLIRRQRALHRRSVHFVAWLRLLVNRRRRRIRGVRDTDKDSSLTKRHSKAATYDAFDSLALLRRCWGAWLVFVLRNRRATKRARDDRIARDFNVAQRTFRGWRSLAIMNSKRREKLRYAVARSQLRAQRYCFDMWKNRILSRRALSRILRSGARRYRRARLRNAFVDWKARVALRGALRLSSEVRCKSVVPTLSSGRTPLIKSVAMGPLPVKVKGHEDSGKRNEDFRVVSFADDIDELSLAHRSPIRKSRKKQAASPRDRSISDEMERLLRSRAAAVRKNSSNGRKRRAKTSDNKRDRARTDVKSKIAPSSADFDIMRRVLLAWQMLTLVMRGVRKRRHARASANLKRESYRRSKTDRMMELRRRVVRRRERSSRLFAPLKDSDGIRSEMLSATSTDGSAPTTSSLSSLSPTSSLSTLESEISPPRIVFDDLKWRPRASHMPLATKKRSRRVKVEDASAPQRPEKRRDVLFEALLEKTRRGNYVTSCWTGGAVAPSGVSVRHGGRKVPIGLVSPTRLLPKTVRTSRYEHGN